MARILILHSVSFIREAIGRQLAKSGYETVLLNYGEQLPTEPIDAAIIEAECNLLAPFIEAVSGLKEVSPDIKILALCCCGQAEFKAKEAGCDKYTTELLSLQKIQDILSGILTA